MAKKTLWRLLKKIDILNYAMGNSKFVFGVKVHNIV